MPDFVYFLARHALSGFAAAFVFVGLLLGFNVAGLRGLVLNSSSGLLAGAALTFVLCLTFGSVQMGIAIMGLGAKEEDVKDDDGGLGEAAEPILAHATVRPR